MTTLPFPLQWPRALARTPSEHRRRSSFGTDRDGDVSLAQARAFVLDELGRMGAVDIVATSNVPTRRDEVGRAPDGDPGVAVWFSLNGEQRCLACDRWQTHGENLRAIGLTVQATRGLERWGVADVVAQVMTGFAALPAGDSQDRAMVPMSNASRATVPQREVGPVATDWRTLLRVQPSDDLEAVRKNYRRLIQFVHPDAGGRDVYAAKLNAAYELAKRELGGSTKQIEGTP